jgi:hypothetical protein
VYCAPEMVQHLLSCVYYLLKPLPALPAARSVQSQSLGIRYATGGIVIMRNFLQHVA